MSTKKEREQAEARQTLLEWGLKPGDTIYTVLRHVSQSGMNRHIDLYKLSTNGDGRILKQWLTRMVCKAGVGTWNERRETCRMDGCGMDMGFGAVYELSRILFRNHFTCLGNNCPSNDHTNGMPRPTAPDPSIEHSDAGYALNQEWL